MRRGLGAALFVATLVAASPVLAQSTSFDVQRYRPVTDPFGFVGINGTTAPGPWAWHATLALDYGNRLLRGPVVENRIGLDAIFQLGLGKRGALALDVPVVLFQNGAPFGTPAMRIDRAAFGDIRSLARVRLLGDPTERRADRPAGAGLALQAGITFPSGSSAFVGERQPTFDAAVLADFHTFGLGVGAILGWRGRPRSRLFDGDRLDDVLRFGVAGKAPVPRVRGLEILAEVEGETGFRGIDTTPIEARVGVRLTRGFVSVSSGAGFGITNAIGSPRSRAYVVAAFTSPVADRDGDGVADADDACAALAEDADGFEDGDGCPDPDDDGDFVLDEDDRCPREAPADGDDVDQDGCSDRDSTQR
jgi:hypothetical protein